MIRFDVAKLAKLDSDDRMIDNSHLTRELHRPAGYRSTRRVRN